MNVGVKSLDSRGEYLVDLLKDGYENQLVGQSPDGAWLFRGDFPDALGLYESRLAVVERQWARHVEARLYD
jgi:hypothetical protein